MMVCENRARDEGSHSDNPSGQCKCVTHRVTIALVECEVYSQKTAQSNKCSEEEHDKDTTSRQPEIEGPGLDNVSQVSPEIPH